MEQLVFDFFFSSRRRHTRQESVSWARRCVQETGTWDISTLQKIQYRKWVNRPKEKYRVIDTSGDKYDKFGTRIERYEDYKPKKYYENSGLSDDEISKKVQAFEDELRKFKYYEDIPRLSIIELQPNRAVERVESMILYSITFSMPIGMLWAKFTYGAIMSDALNLLMIFMFGFCRRHLSEEISDDRYVEDDGLCNDFESWMGDVGAFDAAAESRDLCSPDHREEDSRFVGIQV
eukprot:TRINITY_DN5226_c0_g1_i19.p1 TRINITY_DN5226_c0_g1~~TRINITY_DN5226_c0_g1_i19.p1  ORF type:complete len:234 (-),score=37.68 TRINITY_DN5226_c0_g1_i19:427-1128(-)